MTGDEYLIFEHKGVVYRAVWVDIEGRGREYFVLDSGGEILEGETYYNSHPAERYIRYHHMSYQTYGLTD